MSPRLALPPGRFENTGAGLEPKKQCGKPFRRDPEATEARFQSKLPPIVATHPKGRTTFYFNNLNSLKGTCQRK
jgi:hypothetical protein